VIGGGGFAAWHFGLIGGKAPSKETPAAVPSPTSSEPTTPTTPEPTAEPSASRADTSAALLKARQLKGQGRYAEAISRLREVLQTDAQNEEAHYLIAWCYSNSGRRSEAATEFRWVLAHTGDSERKRQCQDALTRLGG
jgi:hypothetical protein